LRLARPAHCHSEPRRASDARVFRVLGEVPMNWRREKWLKLYQREEGTFAALPLVTRAIAGQLMKYADEIGCIDTGGRSLVETIAFRAGATRGDRRVLKTSLDELLRDGFLIATSTGVRIRNFCIAQGREATSTVQRPSTDRATTEQRPGNDHDTTTTRPSNETRVKSMELFDSGPVVEISRVEKRRVEKRVLQPGKPAENLHAETLRQFSGIWESRYRAKYLPTAADKSQLGRLLNGLEPGEASQLPGLFARYLQSSGKLELERRHDLAFFCTQGGFNRYRANAPLAVNGAAGRDVRIGSVPAPSADTQYPKGEQTL
jgi:hypothetical protein